MKQEIKNNELQERQAYVPASVKVIETSVQRVICASGASGNGTQEYSPETPDWYN